MAISLVEKIQKNLGYSELQKIDPNTQDIKKSPSEENPHNLGQAAIPTVLLGLYKYGNTEQGSDDILRGNMSTNWLELFFGDNKEEAVSKVSGYSGINEGEVTQKMEEIATEAVRLIRENTPEKASFTDIKSFVSQQRNSILVYLPAELQISKVINDTTLDDRTNKMEGPVSNAVHFIERLFSGSTTEKNEVSNDGIKDS